MTGSRWGDDPTVSRGASYDDRFDRLAASGTDVHGEAALVAELAPGPRVLDGGCGTGRVAIELHRRGFTVAGVDLDQAMLEQARAKAPDLAWTLADLASFTADEPFDLIVLAGNVLIFLAPGQEDRTVANLAALLAPGALLVAGFQLRPGGYGIEALDAATGRAGLELVDRWSTWDRARWSPTDDYQVSVHRRPRRPGP